MAPCWRVASLQLPARAPPTPGQRRAPGPAQLEGHLLSHRPARERLQPAARSARRVVSAVAAPGKGDSPGAAQAARPGVHGKPQRGSPTPHGATVTSAGAVNFAVFSSGATAVSLIFADAASGQGNTWHVLVPGVDVARTLYGFRVTGPFAPELGARFDASRVVLDPCAPGVASRPTFAQPAAGGECWPQMLGTLPVDAVAAPFDWQGTSSPNRSLEDTVIYECHVRGFTAHPSAGTAAARGSYAALAEKVPHLVAMGFNALELLPIHEFNECELHAAHVPATGGARVNFWGYSTIGFNAPMARYAASPPGAGAADEVKALVRACHAAGVEVILDVVFNHTAEGNEQGPTISLRGLDNGVYYITAPEGQFYNYSGCGNTVNCNHPVVRRFILDCLRHWAIEYRIDGFRFDLASILTRASSNWETAAMWGGHGGLSDPQDAQVVRGTPLAEPPLVELLSHDGVLRGKKLIAEAWDAGGLYQVGSFPHSGVWAEWNGKFRDAVRQFIKGTDGMAGEFAERLCGSPALYAAGGRQPRHSVNFVTAHDGFSLADLVSYNSKHNEANGEDNRDGEEHNLSWNCGDGDGDDGEVAPPAVKALRRRQMRNLLAALFLSQGVPMVCMGDEYGHTKRGNNNTYCHDAPLNWFDWATAQEDKHGLVRFTAALSAFRASRPALRLPSHPSGDQIAWHGRLPNEPDWSEQSRLVAFTLSDGLPGSQLLYVAFNTSHLPVTLQLPPPGPRRRWRLVMDTALPPPFDLPAGDLSPEVRQAATAQHVNLRVCTYTMLDRATVVMETEEEPPPVWG